MDGEILLDGQFVTIKHKWNAKAGRGESRYPIGAVSGVEVKPGVITSVFTRVVTGGMQRGDFKSQRRGDPLSVEGSVKDRDGFNAMRDRILRALADWDRPLAPASVSPIAAPGLGDQLAQLAALHAQGALSAEEFATAKSRLLGGQSGPQDQPPARW